MNRNPLGTWSRVPPADGPGVHSDEASSAWPVIRKLVSPATARAIAALDGFSIRRNPSTPFGGSATADEEEDDAIGFEELIPVARLVTGQWGVPVAYQTEIRGRLARDIGPQLGKTLVGGRRRLPILRENPEPQTHGEPVKSGDWVNENFWPRMATLRAELASLEVKSDRKYDRLDKKNAKKNKRTWTTAIRQMRADVEWVLSQEDVARAGRGRVVERQGASPDAPIVSVMGIDPSKGFSLRGMTAERAARRQDDRDGYVPTAERKPWGAISAKGNQKLPFAAYSTLPMASCPSAAGCKVQLVPSYKISPLTGKPGLYRKGREVKKGGERVVVGLTKSGYCYSFTSWRYADSFACQFRNCLAEFTDREFAICAGGGADTLPLERQPRIDAAYRGRRARTWHTFCRQMVERDLAGALKPAAKGGKPAFVRIYVDGDINTEDNVFEWMVVCADLQRTRIVENGRVMHPGIQAYGYSKCWDQFLLLDRRRVEDLLGDDWPKYVRWERGSGIAAQAVPHVPQFRWPDNYTLNLSADSAWNDDVPGHDSALRRVTVAMADLPISRGYFASVNLQQSIAGLDAQFANGAPAVFPAPPAGDVPFPFNENRMRAILDMNARMSLAQVAHLTKREDKEAALKGAYIALVNEYQLIDFVKRSVSRAKLTQGQVKITIDSIKKAYKTGPLKGETKADDTMVLELSESLLHSLYRAWFAFLYAHGADPSVKQLYASGFAGQQPMSFSDVVFLELARDAVDLGKAPLSRSDYVEEQRQEGMASSVKVLLNRIESGRGGSLGDAIVYANKKAAAVVGRARSMADIEASLAGQKLTAKQIADFRKKFDQATYVAKYAKVDEYQKKALAVALHEVLWSFNLGGSCPLVCGNCFDTPTPPLPNTDEYLMTRHRCASRNAFKARTIHIGRH